MKYYSPLPGFGHSRSEILRNRIVYRERVAKWNEAQKEYMLSGRGGICYDTHACEHERPYLPWQGGNIVCCLCTHELLCKCRCCDDFFRDADRLSEEIIKSPCWVTGEKNPWGQ